MNSHSSLAFCVTAVPDEAADKARGASPEYLAQDRLGRHLIRLMKLHPELVRFRLGDISQLSTDTKQQLLCDINRKLGITNGDA